MIRAMLALAFVASALGCAREACERTTPVDVRPSGEPASAGGYAQGDRVWIKFGEHWYPGRVVSEIVAGTYEVGYEGYDAEWNRVARAPQLRPYDQAPPSSSLPDSPPNALPEAGHPVNDVNQLQPNDRILILYNEVWWPGVVLSVQGAQVQIRYDGYGAEHDELVGTDRLTIPRE